MMRNVEFVHPRTSHVRHGSMQAQKGTKGQLVGTIYEIFATRKLHSTLTARDLSAQSSAIAPNAPSHQRLDSIASLLCRVERCDLTPQADR